MLQTTLSNSSPQALDFCEADLLRVGGNATSNSHSTSKLTANCAKSGGTVFVPSCGDKLGMIVLRIAQLSLEIDLSLWNYKRFW